MSKGNVSALKEPAGSQDVLTELIREGARQILAAALEAEVQEQIALLSKPMADGIMNVVRNGYLPERGTLTGIGPVSVQVPKLRDRTGKGIKFTSKLIPPYLKRVESVEEFLPLLYLHGVSTGDFVEALTALLGERAAGLSSSSISRMKQKGEEEHHQWNRRSLEGKHHVYIWADGVYFNVRADDDRQCLLVIIGSDGWPKRTPRG